MHGMSTKRLGLNIMHVTTERPSRKHEGVNVSNYVSKPIKLESRQPPNAPARAFSRQMSASPSHQSTTIDWL
jgi:hypothetical protein